MQQTAQHATQGLYRALSQTSSLHRVLTCSPLEVLAGSAVSSLHSTSHLHPEQHASSIGPGDARYRQQEDIDASRRSSHSEASCSDRCSSLGVLSDWRRHSPGYSITSRNVNAQSSYLWGQQHWHFLHTSSLSSTSQPTAADDVGGRQALSTEISTCASIGQLRNVLRLSHHLLDEYALGLALDKVVRLSGIDKAAPQGAKEEVLATLSQVFMEALPRLEPLRVVKLLHSFAMMGHHPGQDQDGLEAICRHVKTQVLPVVLGAEGTLILADLLWALGRISFQGVLKVDLSIWRELSQVLPQRVSLLPYSKLSKVAQSYAMVNCESFTLMDSIARAVYHKIRASHDFDSASITNILDAMAKLKFDSETLYLEVANKLQKEPQAFKPHHIVTAAKAFATRKYDNEDMWRAASHQLLRHMGGMTPQQVQNIAWAWAVRRVADPALYEAVAARALELMPAMKPMNLASLVWSFAQQGYVNKPLLRAASRRMLEVLPSCAIRHVSNALWGFSILDHTDEELLTAVAERAARVLQDPEGRQNLQLGGDEGHAKYTDQDDQVVERYIEGGSVKERVQHKAGFTYTLDLGPVDSSPRRLQFETQNLSDIAWAYADRGLFPKPLFDVIAARAMENMAAFSRTSVVDLSLAYAHAADHDPPLKYPDLFAMIEQHSEQILPELGPQYLSNLLWAFATAQHPLPDAYKKSAIDVAWNKWDRFNDRTVQTRLLWALLTLDVDKLAPNHPVFIAFQEILRQDAALRQQQEQQQQSVQDDTAK